MLLTSVASLDDLAAYFGYADYEKLKGLIYPVPRYNTFEIPKRSGGVRKIEAPAERLKQHQRKLSRDLTLIFGTPSTAAHGFVLGRSIVTNALTHTRRKSVVRIDLKDFFSQIHFGRVKGMFQAPPFDLPEKVATVLAHLCCFNGSLPQGAPTSPPITNFICLGLDRELRKTARRYKARYTRYADDLVFSFPSMSLKQIPAKMFQVEEVAGRVAVTPGPMLDQVIKDHGFALNPAKTRGFDQSDRQMVTGIVVNDGLRVPREYLERIRSALFAWKRYGLSEAQKNAAPVLHRRCYASGDVPSLVRLLRGKLTWLASIEGLSGINYQRLARQFNELASRDSFASQTVKIVPEVRTAADADRATWYLTAEQHTGEYDVINGTAFKFEGNVWLTCAHCVGSLAQRRTYEKIQLTRRDGDAISVRVVDVDWQRDLAVLRPVPLAPVPRHWPFFVAAPNAPKPGDSLGVMGFPASPENQPPVFMRTEIIRIRPVSGVSRIEVDKQLVQGNSGGPVVDANYRVVGIVVEGASGTLSMNSCVAINEVAPLRKS